MPSFRTVRKVPHASGDMFDLVADVEKYPQFVPLCSGVRVRSRATDEAGRTVLTAEMTVSFKLIRETFASRVTLDRDKRHILVEYIDGPFSHMRNHWTFRDEAGPDGQGRSVVEFSIDYEFRSRTLGLLMGSMFDIAFRKLAGAFEKRADAIYGRSPGLAGGVVTP